MKKIIVMILTVCMLASMLCITASAADAPASDVVLRVSVLKRDDSTVVIEDYKVFEDGWNAAMELAVNSKELNKNDYARVIVDIYADWNANKDGEFTEDFFNGKGFNWDAIYFQPNVRMTLNLNGHTINRGLTEWEYNGEVMYIDSRAEVIINDGTITGGYSCNGAGGIHINSNAKVVLNNVNVVGNCVEDDKGAGIAVYGGATLTMNGGSLKNNYLNAFFGGTTEGTIYVENSTAVLNSVLFFENSCNYTSEQYVHGVAVSLDGNAAVTLNDCTLEKNLLVDTGYADVFYCDDVGCVLTINNTTFTGNGVMVNYASRNDLYNYRASIFRGTGTVNINDCKFLDNHIGLVFMFEDCSNAKINVNNCDIINNMGQSETQLSEIVDTSAMFESGMSGNELIFTNCTIEGFFREINGDPEGRVKITFRDCHFDRVRWGQFKNNCIFIDSSMPQGVASIFSEGSLSMIVSLAALVTSIAAIGVCVMTNKKKSVPANAEDEE